MQVEEHDQKFTSVITYGLSTARELALLSARFRRNKAAYAGHIVDARCAINAAESRVWVQEQANLEGISPEEWLKRFYEKEGLL